MKSFYLLFVFLCLLPQNLFPCDLALTDLALTVVILSNRQRALKGFCSTLKLQTRDAILFQLGLGQYGAPASKQINIIYQTPFEIDFQTVCVLINAKDVVTLLLRLHRNNSNHGFSDIFYTALPWATTTDEYHGDSIYSSFVRSLSFFLKFSRDWIKSSSLSIITWEITMRDLQILGRDKIKFFQNDSGHLNMLTHPKL